MQAIPQTIMRTESAMQTHDHYIVYDAERKGAPTLGNAPARVFDGPGDVAEELCGGMAETISLAILREDFETGGLHDRHVQYVVVGELSPHAPVPGALRERSNRDPQSRNITIVRITHGLG